MGAISTRTCSLHDPRVYSTASALAVQMASNARFVQHAHFLHLH
jgi:hypothetical protein